MWAFWPSLFESVSAFSTTGLTMGITPTLNIASKLALTFAMFAGRVGPVSLALALAMQKRKTFQLWFCQKAKLLLVNEVLYKL